MPMPGCGVEDWYLYNWDDFNQLT